MTDCEHLLQIRVLVKVIRVLAYGRNPTGCREGDSVVWSTALITQLGSALGKPVPRDPSDATLVIQP